jgi:hypothetical protein
LKNSYDSSQVKAFYCVAERQDDGVSFRCQFKNHVVSLSPNSWTNVTGLVCEGVNIESDNTFTNYDKTAFVQSVSKSCIVPLEYSNFSAMQLKCNDKILHWIIAKIILCKQENFGRIDDLDLRLMWLIKNRTLVNWPLFFCNRMVSYRLDNSKRLPYPSFLGCVLSSSGVQSSDTFLTKPNPRSGLDIGAVNKMHYYQDGRSN